MGWPSGTLRYRYGAREKPGPPGFADHASFHAACVGGRVVTQGQRGEFVYHVHKDGHTCTGRADWDRVQCGPDPDPLAPHEFVFDMTDAGAEDVEDADFDPGVYTGAKPLEEYSSGQDEDSGKEAEDEHQEE